MENLEDCALVVIRVLAIALIAATFAVLPAQAYAADCTGGTSTNSSVNGYNVQSSQNCHGPDRPGETIVVDLGPTSLGWDPICVRTAMSAGMDPAEYCDQPPDDQPPVIGPEMAATALEFIRPPVPVLSVQPPNGRTLVNFDTNFFTSTGQQQVSVQILGQTVDLNLVPAEYSWIYGDGGSDRTSTPGSSYPLLEVTHRYASRGSVSARVDVTWAATFRVNGGAWASVPGTVTVQGAPVDLQVLTATPTLVGYE
jgi:hypothetical protein